MADESRIRTPEKLRNLQRTLYRQAKSKPKWKAWSLYGDLCRSDVLEEAMRRVAKNRGSSGVDGYSVDRMLNEREAFRDQLQTELREKTYRPEAVLRVWIDKPDGGKRPLGIPTMKDRVVQAALVILLEPIFEADFHPESHAYRPGRRQQDAVTSIVMGILSGLDYALDADLSGYFDTIDHRRLIKLVRKRVSDGSILKLIKQILRAPVVEVDSKGKRRVIPNAGRGVPQGGVISPMLSNLYLDALDHAVNSVRGINTKMVRFADDFVILTKSWNLAEVRQRTGAWLARAGLKLNEGKTREIDLNIPLVSAAMDTVRRRVSWKSGKRYVHVEPHRKSRKRFHEAIREELNHWTTWRDVTEAVEGVNRIARGWANYFHYGSSTKVFTNEKRWLEERLRTWLVKKHRGRAGRKGRYTTFPSKRLYEEYGLYPMPCRKARQ